MSLPTAYVETTIPSFYCTDRRSAASVARREWTRRWWHRAPADLNLVTSRAVLAELAKAAPHNAESRLRLVRDLANANKFEHIRRVNALLGLATPDLVTPLELLGGEDADSD